MQPQSVPSLVSVVLTEETEERDAECLASGFADEGVRWSDQVTSPSSGLECVTRALRPGADGTLSPSDFNSVCPVGPYGTLSPSDLDYVGPVGPCGMLSPSDPDPVGPFGTLSPSDPVGPCGTLSPSDSDSVGPVGPYGILSPSDPVGPCGMLSRLTLTLLAPLARMGHCPRLILLADVGRSPI